MVPGGRDDRGQRRGRAFIWMDGDGTSRFIRFQDERPQGDVESRAASPNDLRAGRWRCGVGQHPRWRVRLGTWRGLRRPRTISGPDGGAARWASILRGASAWGRGVASSVPERSPGLPVTLRSGPGPPWASVWEVDRQARPAQRSFGSVELPSTSRSGRQTVRGPFSPPRECPPRAWFRFDHRCTPPTLMIEPSEVLASGRAHRLPRVHTGRSHRPMFLPRRRAGASPTRSQSVFPTERGCTAFVLRPGKRKCRFRLLPVEHSPRRLAASFRPAWHD